MSMAQKIHRTVSHSGRVGRIETHPNDVAAELTTRGSIGGSNPGPVQPIDPTSEIKPSALVGERKYNHFQKSIAFIFKLELK
jgi:hypothetical protein